MGYFEGFYINGWFGDFGTWLWIVFGGLMLSIITSLIFGFIARVGGEEGHDRE